MKVSLTTHSQETDADYILIDRYLAGDMTAFDELMIAHRRQIYQMCYRIVNNREDAMDLAQEVFIKVFEHLSSFRRESSFKSWLYRIAMNQCMNHVKKSAHNFVEFTDAIASLRSSVHADLEHSERRELLRNLVRRLPPKQREILEMRINDQLTYEEIGNMSGRKVSTIKASVFFALEKLKKLIKEPKGNAV